MRWPRPPRPARPAGDGDGVDAAPAQHPAGATRRSNRRQLPGRPARTSLPPIITRWPRSCPNGAASALPAQGALLGAAPLAGLGSLTSLMGGQPDVAGGSSASPRTGTHATGVGGSGIDAVVSRALSQHGIPYAWGGGGKAGPGRGDDGVVGFDCSSLMQYAFAGAGVDLPRTTYQQIGLGHTVSRSDIQPGDLIFSEFGEGGAAGPGHVQLAISPTHVVEAPHTGANVQVSAVPAGHIVVKRVL